MDDRVKKHIDFLYRVDRFGRTYANYFLRTTVAGQQFAVVRAAFEEIERNMRKLSLTPGAAQPLSISLTRAMLMRTLEDFEVTADAIAISEDVPEEQFRAPWAYDDNDMLIAAAYEFAKDAEPMRRQFLRFEMPKTFIEDLIAIAEEFTDAIEQRRQRAGKPPSTAELIDDALGRGLRAIRILDAIVHNLFDSNLLGLTDWYKASVGIGYAEVRYRTAKTSDPAPDKS